MNTEMVINAIISVVTGLGTLFFGYYFLGARQVPEGDQKPKRGDPGVWLWGVVLVLWLAVGSFTAVLFNYDAKSVRQAVTDTESILANKIDSSQQAAVAALQTSSQQSLALAQGRIDAEIADLLKTSTTLIKANRSLIVDKANGITARLDELKGVMLKLQDYTSTSMEASKNILSAVTGLGEKIDHVSLDTGKVLDLTGKVFSLDTDNTAALQTINKSVDSLIAAQKGFNSRFDQAFGKEGFDKADIPTTSAFVQALYLNSLYDVVKSPESLAETKKAYQAALATNARFHLDYPWDVQKRKEIITSFSNAL